MLTRRSPKSGTPFVHKERRSLNVPGTDGGFVSWSLLRSRPSLHCVVFGLQQNVSTAELSRTSTVKMLCCTIVIHREPNKKNLMIIADHTAADLNDRSNKLYSGM